MLPTTATGRRASLFAYALDGHKDRQAGQDGGARRIRVLLRPLRDCRLGDLTRGIQSPGPTGAGQKQVVITNPTCQTRTA